MASRNTTTICTGAILAILLPSVASAAPAMERLTYQAESRFQMEGSMLGVPAGKKDKRVTVRTEMDLDCTRTETAMSCRISHPEVAWTAGDRSVKRWDDQVANDLDGATVDLHWDRFGGLTKVDLQPTGPEQAPYATLRQHVIERAMAGFDLPLGASADPNPDLTMDTRLVPAFRPSESARHRLEHHVERVPYDGTSQITTRGTVAWNDARIDMEEPENRFQGRVEAEAIWDNDEAHLIRRRWKSEVGNDWFTHVGSVRLQKDDDGEREMPPAPDDTVDHNRTPIF